MSFKSRILKLSILIMLVLVLLPAIAAEDSSEAFYVEYTYESDEVVVEESVSVDEIGYAHEDVSRSYEIEETVIEEEYEVNVPVSDQSYEIDDAVIVQEEIECSVVETHDNIDEINEESEINVFCEDVIDSVNYNDVDSVNREVTIEESGIIKQGHVIFISGEVNGNINIIIHNGLYSEAEVYETHSFKRSLIKALELKNNLLISQDVSSVFADDFMTDVDGDIIACTDKITTDFVFSIDNSVIGDDSLVNFLSASFCLNFTPFFDAFLCSNFLDFESFFDGDNKIDHCFHELVLI